MVDAYAAYDTGAGEVDAKAFLNERIIATAPAEAIYLAIDPLNDTRGAIAPELGTDASSYAPTGGADIDFDNDEIRYAYANYAVYALWLIYDHYSAEGFPLPIVYFNFGSEASDLLLGPTGQAAWNNFEGFAREFAGYIRSYDHVDADPAFAGFVRSTQLLFSVVLRSPGSADMVALGDAVADSDGSLAGQRITDFTDLIGVSTYGYLFYDDQWGGYEAGASTLPGSDKVFVDDRRGDPTELPADWLSQIESIAPEETYAITETGWIGEDLLRPAMANFDEGQAGDAGPDDYLVPADETYQNTYVAMTLEEADRLAFEFVIFFTLVDYDIGSDYLVQSGSDQDFLNLYNAWVKTGFFQPVDAVDTHSEYEAYTGALDDVLAPRESWTTWTAWFAKGRAQAF